MAKTFNFEIITPARVVYNGIVQGISADGTEGAFGVLADHAPLITELKTGIIMAEDSSGKTMRFAVEGGFLEVVANNVVVLTDTCKNPPSTAKCIVLPLESSAIIIPVFNSVINGAWSARTPNAPSVPSAEMPWTTPL